MNRKEIYQAIQSVLRDKGYFSPKLTPLHLPEAPSNWTNFLEDFLEERDDKKYSQLIVLYDFAIEQDNKMIIGTASSRELSSGEIQFEEGTIFKFKSQQIKEQHLVCLCLQTSLRTVLEELRKKKTMKTKPYRNKIRNTLIKEKCQIVIQDDDDSFKEQVELPKKSQLSEVNHQPKTRKLMFCSESSESQQIHYRDKLSTEIALFSLMGSSRPKRRSDNHEEILEIQHPKTKQSKMIKTLSVDSHRPANSNSQNTKQVLLAKAKSKKEIRKEEVSKQSQFMSNWFKKSN